MACGDRWRVLPRWLIALMTQRIYAVMKPAVRLLQHLIAGTYRPHKPRSTPRAPSERIPTTVPELEHRHWLLRLLPASWDSSYSAGGAAQALRELVADPAMVALMQDVPTLARHIRPLCRMLNFDLPEALRPKSKPRAPRPPKPADAPKRAYIRRAPPPPPPAAPIPVRIEPQYPGATTPIGFKNWTF